MIGTTLPGAAAIAAPPLDDGARLTAAPFDLLVIGGGVYGAFAAWDAALRGLRVALVEKEDWGGATSSNCLKIAHGGLRYLQTLDLPRMRESTHERAALLRMAPHLLEPLPCVMPTSGAGTRSAPALGAALLANAAVSWDRNRDLPASRHLPAGALLPPERLHALGDPIEARRDGGGALWYDALMRSPERIVVGVVRAAEDAGATCVNHARATALLRDPDGGVIGALVETFAGERVEVRARITLNAAGPWAWELVKPLGVPTGCDLARGINLVTSRPATQAGVAARHPRDGRMFFAVPWNGRMMLGTAYAPKRSRCAEPAELEREVRGLIEDLNAAIPGLSLRHDEVTRVHAGYLPAAGSDRHGAPRLLDRPFLVDHRDAHGIPGLVTMIGVKWTTARGVAERAVDLVQRRLTGRRERGGTDRRPLHGGDVGDPEAFEREPVPARYAGLLEEDAVRRLRRLHGTGWTEVAELARERPALLAPVASTPTLAAEVVHAVRHEGARTLCDVVLRRTELGSGGHPGDRVARAVAELCAAELGWGAPHVATELALLRGAYPGTTP